MSMASVSGFVVAGCRDPSLFAQAYHTTVR